MTLGFCGRFCEEEGMKTYPTRVKELLLLYPNLTKEQLMNAAKAEVIIPVGQQGRNRLFDAKEVGVYDLIRDLSGYGIQRFIMEQFRRASGCEVLAISKNCGGQPFGAGGYSVKELGKRAVEGNSAELTIIIDVKTIEKKVQRGLANSEYSEELAKRLMDGGLSKHRARKESTAPWWDIDPKADEKVYLVYTSKTDQATGRIDRSSEILRVHKDAPAPSIAVQPGQTCVIVDLTAIKAFKNSCGFSSGREQGHISPVERGR